MTKTAGVKATDLGVLGIACDKSSLDHQCHRCCSTKSLPLGLEHFPLQCMHVQFTPV